MSNNNKPRGINTDAIMNKVSRVTFAPNKGRGEDHDPLSGEPTRDLTESKRPRSTEGVHAGQHVRIEGNGRVMTKQVQNRVPSSGVLYFTDGTSYIPTNPQYESVEVVDRQKKQEMQEAAEQVRMEQALRERHNQWGGSAYDTYLDKLAAILHDFLSANGRNQASDILDMLEAGPGNNIPEMEHHEFAPKEDIEALRGKWQEVADRVRQMVRAYESNEPQKPEVSEAFDRVNQGRGGTGRPSNRRVEEGGKYKTPKAFGSGTDDIKAAAVWWMSQAAGEGGGNPQRALRQMGEDKFLRELKQKLDEEGVSKEVYEFAKRNLQELSKVWAPGVSLDDLNTESNQRNGRPVSEGYELGYVDGEYNVGGAEPFEDWVRRIRDNVQGNLDTAEVRRVSSRKGNTQATIRLNDVLWPAPLDLHIRPIRVDDQTRKDVMDFTLTAPTHGDRELASVQKGMEGGEQKLLKTTFLTRNRDGLIDQAVDRLMSMESTQSQSGSDISERIQRHLNGEDLDENYDAGPPADGATHINPYAGSDAKDPAPGRETAYRAQPFVDNLQFNASVARKVSEAFRAIDRELAEGLEQFSTRCLEVADEIKQGNLSKQEAEEWASYATSISEMALDRYDEEIEEGYGNEMTHAPGGDFYDAPGVGQQDRGDYEHNPDAFNQSGDAVSRGDYSGASKKKGYSGRKATTRVTRTTT